MGIVSAGMAWFASIELEAIGYFVKHAPNRSSTLTLSFFPSMKLFDYSACLEAAAPGV